MKGKFIRKKKNVYLLVLVFTFLFFGFLPLQSIVAEEPEEPGGGAGTVKIIDIDYDQALMRIDPQGNTRIYYAASGKTAWNEIEGEIVTGDNDTTYFILDISWISVKSAYKMDLKGSENGTIVTVTLPAANNKLKVTYNKAEETLVFHNNNDDTAFEWKKSGFYEKWNEVTSQDDGKFQKAIEGLKARGGKIIVRLPQRLGTSDEDVGERPSNQVVVSIPKRANAPSLKVNVNTLICNTTTTMEYQIYSIDGILQDQTTAWSTCEKGMSVTELAPQAFNTESSAGKDVVVALRKAATEKASYSKTSYFTIPAQNLAPTETEIDETITENSFSISFPKASKENPYQYAVVSGNTLSWKAVTSSKAIKFTSKSVPAGTKIYVRLRGIPATKSVSLRLPSAYATITVSYSDTEQDTQ